MLSQKIESLINIQNICSSIGPQTTISQIKAEDTPKEPSSKESPKESAKEESVGSGGGSPVCPHLPIQQNVTLVGGIHSGNFSSHGPVDSMLACVEKCCNIEHCDLAFMVKRTCFSVQCASQELCATKNAKPSPYNPTVSAMSRFMTKRPLRELFLFYVVLLFSKVKL